MFLYLLSRSYRVHTEAVGLDVLSHLTPEAREKKNNLEENLKKPTTLPHNTP